MAGKKFVFDLIGDPNEKLQQVKRAAARRGITFQGDNVEGRFSSTTLVGRLAGYYRISGGKITVTVNDKPVFISWQMIEGQLRQFLEG
jgi:hypothetical protein